MKELLTLEEFANRAGLSIHTIRIWRRKGLPVVKLSSGSVRVDLEVAESWLKERSKRKKGECG